MFTNFYCYATSDEWPKIIENKNTLDQSVLQSLCLCVYSLPAASTSEEDVSHFLGFRMDIISAISKLNVVTSFSKATWLSLENITMYWDQK